MAGAATAAAAAAVANATEGVAAMAPTGALLEAAMSQVDPKSNMSAEDKQLRLLHKLIESNDQSVQNVVLLWTAFFGVIGYFVQSWLQARDSRRLWRLERVKAQLEELYGPLRCSQYMGATAFQNMLNRYADLKGQAHGTPGIYSELRRELRAASGSTKSEVVKFWMSFTRDFALPNNKKMMELLVTKGHLHDGQFPKSFLDFLGHVAEQQVMVQRWEQEDHLKLVEVFSYPSAFNVTIRNRTHKLKELQAALLGDDQVFDDEQEEEDEEEECPGQGCRNGSRVAPSADSRSSVSSSESTNLFRQFDSQLRRGTSAVSFHIRRSNPRARGLSMMSPSYSKLSAEDEDLDEDAGDQQEER